jgi:hypothetical protein
MQPNAAYAIACLGPCALFMGIISSFRGFFQGHGNMAPTSASQVLEAFVKLVIGLGLAYLVTQRYHDIPLAAAGAILGVTGSCVISAIFLYSRFRPAYQSLPQSQDTPDSFSKTAAGLLAIAIPITIGSAGLQVINLIDNALIMRRLQDAAGFNYEAAKGLRGLYGTAQTLFIALCATLLPESRGRNILNKSDISMYTITRVKNVFQYLRGVSLLDEFNTERTKGEVAKDFFAVVRIGRIGKKAFGKSTANRCFRRNLAEIFDTECFGREMGDNAEYLRLIEQTALFFGKIKEDWVLVRGVIQINLDNHSVTVKTREFYSLGA